MAAPTVQVLLGFAATPALGDNFVLNDGVKGKLNNTSYTLGGTVWTDVSDWLVGQISSSRGRSREVDQYQAGTFSFTLWNQDRRFDPLNTASPYYPGIVPRTPVQCFIDGVQVFGGYVDDYDVQYQLPNICTVRVTCLDAFTLLSNSYISNWTVPQQSSGARISAALELIGFPAAASIDAGYTTLQPNIFSPFEEDTGASQPDVALTDIQAFASSEWGFLFVDRTGVLQFLDRYAIIRELAEASGAAPGPPPSYYNAEWAYNAGDPPSPDQIVVDVPSNYAEGDLLLLFITTSHGGAGLSWGSAALPSGWTLVEAATSQPEGTNYAPVMCCTHICAVTEPASYTFALPSGVNWYNPMAGMICLRGEDQAAPIDTAALAGFNVDGGPSQTAPSVVPIQANDTLVCFFSDYNGANMDGWTPGGPTEWLSENSGGGLISEFGLILPLSAATPTSPYQITGGSGMGTAVSVLVAADIEGTGVPVIDTVFSDLQTDQEQGAYAYQAVGMVSATLLLYNQVMGTRNSDQTIADDAPELQIANGAASQALYLIRALSLPSLENNSDSDVLALCDFVLSLYQQPEVRFDTVEIELSALSEQQVQSLVALDLTDLCLVKRTPPGTGTPATIAVVSYIDQVAFALDVSGSRYRMTLSFGAATDQQFMVLDNPTYGVLNTNVLAY